MCLFDFTPCHADDVSEQGYLQDMPVVLSASRLSQPLSEAPNAVTVVDRAMIKASGFRNIADLFKMVPGMYVDYLNGYTPIVSYRGTTDEFTRRMQVLVDGRSVYLSPFNTVDWEDLPLHIDDIERIEVVRGPAAASHGSNSTSGVISITTRDASALNGASISATKGNAGISDAAAHFGRSGEHLDYRLTLGARSDNGLNFTNGYANSSTTQQANLRTNYHPNGTDSFDLQLGFSSGTRTTGNLVRTAYRADFSFLHDIKNSSDFQQLTWLHTLGQHDDIQVHYYHIYRNSIDQGYTFPIIPNPVDQNNTPNIPHGPWLGASPSYWVTNNFKVDRHELELQYTAQIGSANRLVWGVGARNEAVDTSSMFLAPQSLHQSRFFAHDEWRISQPLLLNAGAMLEDDGMGHNNFSPRVALNYHVMPAHTLRASISVAYRNPSLVEERGNQRFYLPNNDMVPIYGPNWTVGLYQHFLSSGGLRPERALSREIGYIGDFKNGLTVDARVYNDQVSDIIWLDGTLVPGSVKSPTWDFRNDFSAHYTGLEGTVKYGWGEHKNSLSFNYAHQLVSAVLLGAPKLPPLMSMFQTFAQDYSKTVPLNSGSLLFARQMSDGVSFSFGYYQQGTVLVLAGTSPQPLNRRLDMRVAKQFKSTGKIGGGEVSLVVQNVLQDKNVGYSPAPSSNSLFDRLAYLAATLDF